MKLITPQFAVDATDGFKNDIFNRKPFGEALLNLVINSSDELVVSLDGKWGEGKTTFVKMWQGLLLKEKNIPSIYIDAFKSDYADDAFISIAGAITTYSETNCISINKRADLMVKAKKVGGQLAGWGAKIAIKAATLGVVNGSDLEALGKVGEDAVDEVANAVGNLVEARLKSHSCEMEVFESFRKTLSELPENLRGNTSKKLVIIIDELDRCKPSFAVEMLEKIKHLFSVKNIVFVLVMNKGQLESSIRSVYGAEIDAHTYLQKFISVETSIPRVAPSQFSNADDLAVYGKKLLELHELDNWTGDNKILGPTLALANHLNFSFRQLEKTFTNLSVIFGATATNEQVSYRIVALIATLKVFDPVCYDELAYDKISLDELLHKIRGENISSDDVEMRAMHHVIQWTRFAMMTESQFNDLPQNDQLRRLGNFIDHNISRQDLIKIYCRKLSMIKFN